MVKTICRDNQGKEVIMIRPDSEELKLSEEEIKRNRIDAYRDSHPTKETMGHVLGKSSHPLYIQYYSRWIQIA